MRKVTSKYSPDKEIREDQYLVEIICENRARRYKLDLPMRFWQLEEWEKFYKFQIMLVQGYLKQYGFTKMLSFITTKKINNLVAKWISDAVKKYSVPEQHKEITFENLNTTSLGRANKGKQFDYLD